MQTRDFVAIVDNIAAGLQVDALYKWFATRFGQQNQGITAEAKTEFEQHIFELSNRAAVLRADARTKAVMDSFGLSDILSHEHLAALITLVRGSGDTNTLWHTASDKRRAWSLYFTLTAFHNTRNTIRRFLQAERLLGVQNDEAVVDLSVIDHSDEGVTLRRVVATLESLQRLAEAVAATTDESSELRFAFADSGSDLGLGIIAKKGIATAIEALFRDGIRHLRFWKEDGFDRKLESMSKGLDFISQLQARAQAGTLDKAVAAKAERAILKEMSGLLGSGVKLHEDVPVPAANDRAFLAEGTRPRLLNSGPGSSSDDAV